jgi:hypothetical protein
MLVGLSCGIGAGAAWLAALSERKAGVGLMNPNLWSELTPEGARLRNLGFKFWLGGVVTGLLLFALMSLWQG